MQQAADGRPSPRPNSSARDLGANDSAAARPGTAPLTSVPISSGASGLAHSLLDRIAVVPEPGSFVFGGKTYDYFQHNYDLAWATERAVEIPIIQALVAGSGPDRTLEIGNVLSHYFRVAHDVVDRYEAGERVLNIDVVEFQPGKNYELIVSISTLEHVGWDEQPRDPDKVLRAVGHLAGLLSPRGRLAFTFPVGYSPFVMELVELGLPPEASYQCLRRVSADNRWVEASWNEIRGLKYDFPYPGANGLVVGTVRRSP